MWQGSGHGKIVEKISYSEDHKELERVLKYVEQLEETSTEALLLKRVLRDVVRNRQAVSRQKLITKFFNQVKLICFTIFQGTVQ